MKRLQLGGLMAILSAAACGEYRVPVGSEGNAVDSGQCLGEQTKCSPPLEGDWLQTIEPAPCGQGLAGTFTSTFPAVPSRFNGNTEIVAVKDGSAWVLSADYDTDQNTAVLRAEHLDVNGVSLGGNDDLVHVSAQTMLAGHIAPGPDGGASVIVYTVYAATADDDLDERTQVLQLDPEANLKAAPIALAGMSEGRIAVGSRGTLTVAANAAANAAHARLVRLTPNGKPLFVQPNVPSNGQGIGTGVALALEDGGSSTILSERSRTFQNRTATFGVAKYDASGNLTKNWLIPTNFESGYSATVTNTPDGGFAMSGLLDTSTGALLVYSAEGEPLSGWQLPGGDPASLSVDAATGAIVAYLQGNVAVLSPDGATCKIYADATPEETTFEGGTITFSDGWTLSRPGLPLE